MASWPTIMLPDNLIWILDKLGLEWPDINEGEVWQAAEYIRQFRDDLEGLIQNADQKVGVDLAAGVRSRGGEAYITAWNTNRSQNMQRFLDSLDPVATGVNGAAVAVAGLKGKFLAEIAFTVATIVPLLLLGPLGAGAAAAKMVAQKIAMGIIMDLAISGLIEVVDGPVIRFLEDEIPGLIQLILDAPLVEDTMADLGGVYFDIQAMEQAEADMDQHATDTETIITEFLANIANLHFTE
ncbi:hypothetical protein [Nocardioides sp.]|uniref:WXG100-like domain-containing protein n=1 Tax=Nocardioides sp. TaxID=35761 RepID=UPI002BB13D11|nr:hypothetical protein [Nocardioides sp.]HSX66541.1 hypothetical protein [Nocardioides sp.]